jgi:hypothetical protein
MVAAEGPLPDSAAVPAEPEAPITVSSAPEPDYTATVSEPEPPVEPAVATAPVHRSYSPPPGMFS